MSTRSADRSAVAPKKGPSVATHHNGRSAAARQTNRSAVPRDGNRSAVNSKKDRSSLCTFTFADGRCCRTPRCSGSSYCFFHARKEAQARAAD